MGAPLGATGAPEGGADVSSLRRKLGDPKLLHTVRGLGYVLKVAP